MLHALTTQDLSDLLAAYHLQADPANALIAPSLIRNEQPHHRCRHASTPPRSQDTTCSICRLPSRLKVCLHPSEKRHHFLHVPYVIAGLRAPMGADPYRDAIDQRLKRILVCSIVTDVNR